MCALICLPWDTGLFLRPVTICPGQARDSVVGSSGRVGQPARVAVLPCVYGKWSIAIVLYTDGGVCRSRSHLGDIIAWCSEHIS